jgi:hypothetical protein
MSYCVLCVCFRILMSSSSTLPLLVVCRRVHVLLCSVCMFTYIDVQQFDFTSTCCLLESSCLIVFCVYVYVY